MILIEDRSRVYRFHFSKSLPAFTIAKIMALFLADNQNARITKCNHHLLDEISSIIKIDAEPPAVILTFIGKERSINNAIMGQYARGGDSIAISHHLILSIPRIIISAISQIY